MPDRAENMEDLERGPLMSLPMGGLLSELLASEGVDPANLTDVPAECEAGEAPEAAAPDSGPESTLMSSPAPQAGQNDEAGQGGGIAMPGLLADLIEFEQAAGDEDPGPAGPSWEATPADLRPPEAAEPPPQLNILPQAALSKPPVESGDAATSFLEPAETADHMPARDARADDLAIPGLFALLSEEAEQGPGERIASGDLSGGDPAQAVHPDAADLSAPGITPAEPSREGVTLAPVEAEPLVAAAGGPAAIAFTPGTGASEEFDILDLEDALEAPGAASGLAAADGGELKSAPNSEAEPPSGGHKPEAEQPREQARPAALPAAGRGAAAEAAEQGELFKLIEQIDGEIDASPASGAEAVQTDDTNAERFVVFRLGGNSFGLHMKLVREVEKAGRVTPVPSAPALLRGLINLRGEILPLIDPRPLLGLEPAAPRAGGYLVVVQARGDEMPVALLVDELGGIAPVDPASVAPVYASEEVEAGLAAHALGQAEHRGRSVLLLDHRRLVTDDALLEAFEGGGLELEETGR